MGTKSLSSGHNCERSEAFGCCSSSHPQKHLLNLQGTGMPLGEAGHKGVLPVLLPAGSCCKANPHPTLCSPPPRVRRQTAGSSPFTTTSWKTSYLARRLQHTPDNHYRKPAQPPPQPVPLPSPRHAAFLPPAALPAPGQRHEPACSRTEPFPRNKTHNEVTPWIKQAVPCCLAEAGSSEYTQPAAKPSPTTKALLGLKALRFTGTLKPLVLCPQPNFSSIPKKPLLGCQRKPQSFPNPWEG